jgi:hypothetical protein
MDLIKERLAELELKISCGDFGHRLSADLFYIQSDVGSEREKESKPKSLFDYLGVDRTSPSCVEDLEQQLDNIYREELCRDYIFLYDACADSKKIVFREQINEAFTSLEDYSPTYCYLPHVVESADLECKRLTERLAVHPLESYLRRSPIFCKEVLARLEKPKILHRIFGGLSPTTYAPQEDERRWAIMRLVAGAMLIRADPMAFAVDGFRLGKIKKILPNKATKKAATALLNSMTAQGFEFPRGFDVSLSRMIDGQHPRYKIQYERSEDMDIGRLRHLVAREAVLLSKRLLQVDNGKQQNIPVKAVDAILRLAGEGMSYKDGDTRTISTLFQECTGYRLKHEEPIGTLTVLFSSREKRREKRREEEKERAEMQKLMK